MSKPVKVLIVEDSEDDAKLALRAIGRGGFAPTYRRVQTAVDLETALAEERWDAVISDFNMPGFTGMDALRIFRSIGLDIPFILISGTIGEETAVSAMKAGASDYVMKKNLARLAPALERELKETQMRADHRQAQAELTDSEGQFRQMAENIREVFWLTDLPKNQILYVSPAYEEIWGRSRESLYASPRDWIDAIHSEDRERVLRAAQTKQASGKYVEEYRIVRPDGAIRWIRDRAFPVFRKEREVYRIAGLAEDITERKQAADELRRSESLKGAILESSLDCVITIDHEGKIVEFNPAAAAAFGLTREQALGKVMVDLIVPPRLRDAHRRGFAHYLATGIGPILGKRLELEAIRADGTEFPIELAITPIGGTSKPMFTGFIHDITARKAVDGKIKRLNRVYAVLSRINTLIVRVHDRDELFREACRIAVEHGNFGMAWIGLLDPATQDVTPVAWAGECAEELSSTKSSAREDSPRGKGAVGQAIRERRPAFNNDIVGHSVDRPRLRKMVSLGFRAQITLPLFEHQAVVGTLTMYAREPTFFDDEELRLLSELAGDISFALANISRQRKLDKLARIRGVSGEINAAILRVQDRQELLDATCNIAVEQAGFPLAWIGMLNPATLDLKPAAVAGTVLEYAKLLAPSIRADIPAGQGTNGRAFREKKPIVENDMTANPNAGFMRGEALKLGIQAALSLPLLVEGAPVGVLGLYTKEKEYFDDEEISLLTEVAGNISFALEHISKEEKIVRLSRIQAVMSSINMLIVRVRDRDELFREACQIAVEHGQFKQAWIGVVDRTQMKITPVASAGVTLDFLAIIKLRLLLNEDVPFGNTLTAQAVREKKVAVSNDAQNDPKVAFREEHAKRGTRSMVALPLQVSDEVVSVLVLYSEETDFFNEEELKLLAELAGNIEFAIDHMDKQGRLDYLAYYDVLTGLANRSLFLERLAQYMRSAVSGGHKLAVGLIDLERFKNINDSLGQPAGDALLKQVAQWLTHNLGDANLVARLGADHFAVVLPELKPQGEVARLVEKLMEDFLEHPFRLNDAEFRIATKVGVALFPDDGTNADALFKHAEAALKKAKASGERYLFYSQTMTETMSGKLTLENQLRQALGNGEFVLHYQPKVNLASGKLTGAEALIRWNDPRTGLVAPGQFIPILEETGLIYEVGRWALHKAVEDYLRWRMAGLAAVRVAVNVSPLQLRNRGFIAEIQQTIDVDAQAAAGLELEITESLIMKDVKRSIASLQAIRAMGVSIAIDDFGTGFSSLSYLAKLPVDTLKIDRSFVIDMTEGPEGLTLVSTIITLAHSLKLKVVAEGVETGEQSNLLRLLKCDEMQGYLFSKPVPVEQMTALLKTNV